MTDQERLLALGGAALALVLVSYLAARGIGALVRRAHARAAARARARARERLAGLLRGFQENCREVQAAAHPVFQRIRTQEEHHSTIIGHGRGTPPHTMGYRWPDFPALRGLAAQAGVEAGPIFEMEHAVRKFAATVTRYNEGALDDDPTPVATVVEMDQSLNRLVVLATMCLDRCRA